MRLGEKEFSDLAAAASLAQDAGDTELAERLDVMARKANLECTKKASPAIAGFSGLEPRLRWQDMPSTLT